jgi:AcrR family transcriptional regulator
MARSADGSRKAASPRAKRRETYHHGDLRQALIDAARALLAESGPSGLSLRAAARAAGVSQTAPYRHFESREDMLAAVAEDGFRRLHARMVASVAGERSKRALQRIAIEYVRFALEYPAEYRVMFGREGAELERTEASAALNDASRAVMNLLQGGIEEMQKAGALRRGSSSIMALTAWGLVHGLVMLVLDGQGARTRETSPEELVEQATSLLMIGMAAPGETRRR